MKGSHKTNWMKYSIALDQINTCNLRGRISQAIGLTLEAVGPQVRIGELCHVKAGRAAQDLIPCEVVGFKNTDPA